MLYKSEEYLFGSRIHKWKWRLEATPSPQELAQSISHPHREFLIGAITRGMPARSALEIGCNMGQNLRLLAGKFPEASFQGLDINPNFIEKGQHWLLGDGIKNISLQPGTGEDLSKFGDKSIDLTFSDATLIYLGPDKIDQAIGEMIRVTRKSLLFNEWNLDGTRCQERSTWYFGHWVHDYKAILTKHAPNAEVRIHRLPEGLWAPGGGWEKYGALIEVDLKNP
ncbi:MAG: hypothetical protein A3J74_05700 [Elusimicrobia bacterium RIFCSPHIGHO2_02_FULL_57_9]|nr:MAG: hypothetical protein A3J74_05700 [Elusimicrobia bacterium RIFCSPHIGHO2_02_FULL_57_9]